MIPRLIRFPTPIGEPGLDANASSYFGTSSCGSSLKHYSCGRILSGALATAKISRHATPHLKEGATHNEFCSHEYKWDARAKWLHRLLLECEGSISLLRCYLGDGLDREATVSF